VAESQLSYAIPAHFPGLQELPETGVAGAKFFASQKGEFLPCSGVTNVSDHETDQDLESRRNAESALESAARQLGGTASAGGRTQAGQRGVLQGRQERDLEIWAKEQGFWLNAVEALAGFIIGGEEHRISRGEFRYHKATYPGRYGFTLIPVNGQPTLTRALPGEYLERLLLVNQIFGDAIRLKGITREAGGLVILISQPTVVGIACGFQEMVHGFAAMRFLEVPGFCAGHPGSLSFYRDLDQIAAFDVHPANLLRDMRGVLLPIDIILTRVGNELAECFSSMVG
jgi:hypothetical protein